jgi:hypothetical protein
MFCILRAFMGILNVAHSYVAHSFGSAAIARIVIEVTDMTIYRDGNQLKAALTALAVGLSAAVALASPLPKILGASQPGRVDSPAPGEETAYIIKASEGKVAVFMPPGDEPVLVTDIDISSLRERDAAAINKGLPIGAYEELLQTLEDFDA